MGSLGFLGLPKRFYNGNYPPNNVLESANPMSISYKHLEEGSGKYDKCTEASMMSIPLIS